jgi:phosphoglycolate phosphatase-like HAD superfamily hydrolase
MVLVLFDIDGTLIDAHGLGRRTFETALGEAAGRPVAAGGVPFAGRTDPAIAADMLRAAGITDDELPEVLSRGLAHFAALMLAASESAPVSRLPGVEAMLERLEAAHGVSLGLLTGNMEVSAFAKLRAAGLERFFGFGAFGSDDRDRYALPKIALGRARSLLGVDLDPASAVIVGDTPHDVGCGRGAGMKTVAVCTGPVSRAELEASGPDLLLDDLRDAAPFYRFLDLPPA